MCIRLKRNTALSQSLGMVIFVLIALGGVIPLSAQTRTMAAGYAVSTITMPSGAQENLVTPPGLRVTLYASGLPNARFMALGPHGVVFVGSWYAGTVSALVPAAGGTQAARIVTLLSGLTVPHSVYYRNGLLYVAEEGQVSTWRYNASTVSVSDQQVLVSLPTGGRHVTRTVVIGPDGYLYVSVGSSCNECWDYNNRGVIMRYRLDGSGGIIYAHGLRNSVGMAFQPGTGRLWAADNGSDLLGNNIPPDEINIIKRGGNYGWPYCWGDGQTDSEISSSPGYCKQTINPVVSLQAHSAPLGVAFVTGSLLPAAYRGGMVVAYHGSAYRTPLTGYKVVFIPVQGAHAGAPQDLITGWLPSSIGSSGNVWGRPVGVLIAADGSLLISDDLAGAIYRLAPAQ